MTWEDIRHATDLARRYMASSFRLDVAGIDDGHLFQTFRRGGRPSGRGLSHSEVPRLVKKYAVRIGLDPADYSGHSLRAGFVTIAAGTPRSA